MPNQGGGGGRGRCACWYRRQVDDWQYGTCGGGVYVCDMYVCMYAKYLPTLL